MSCLATRVVKFAGLSDDDGSTTDDEDVFYTTIFRHCFLKLGKVIVEIQVYKQCGKGGKRLILDIFRSMKWKFIIALLLFSFYSRGQDREEVKVYYTAHNQILENFARSQDTVKYLEEMHSFIDENGKNYVRLTRHSSFLDFCIEQENYEVAKLLIQKQLEYSVNTHYYLKDTAARNSSKQKDFYNRPEILDIINNSDDAYKELMSTVSLFQSIMLNSLHKIDKFGRNLTYLPSIDTVRHIENEVLLYTDSTNLIRLYEYIEEFGFPKDEELGYFSDFIIMFHTYCRPCGTTFTMPNGEWFYDYLDSVYYGAVLDGLYRNTGYAYLKDQSMNQQWADLHDDCEHQGQKYVTWFQGKLSGDLYDAKNIDKYRAEIFLPPYWVDAVLNGWGIPDDYPVPDNVKLKY